jgi:hypothetical protein
LEKNNSTFSSLLLHSDQPPWHTFLLNLKETLMGTYGKNLATKASFHSHHKQFERQREA